MLNPTTYNSRSNIVKTSLNGKNVLQATQGTGSSEAKNILVKKNDEGQWAPVEKLEGSINRDEMALNYGLWTDTAKTDNGFLGTGLFTKTTRAQDGEIQADEVKTFEPEAKGQKGRLGITKYSWQTLGSEIKMADEGFGTLNTVGVQGYGAPDQAVNDSVLGDPTQWLVV